MDSSSGGVRVSLTVSSDFFASACAFLRDFSYLSYADSSASQDGHLYFGKTCPSFSSVPTFLRLPAPHIWQVIIS